MSVSLAAERPCSRLSACVSYVPPVQQLAHQNSVLSSARGTEPAVFNHQDCVTASSLLCRGDWPDMSDEATRCIDTLTVGAGSPVSSVHLRHRAVDRAQSQGCPHPARRGNSEHPDSNSSK